MGARRIRLVQAGQMESLMPHIARPEGRVHFAGDHGAVARLDERGVAIWRPRGAGSQSGSITPGAGLGHNA